MLEVHTLLIPLPPEFFEVWTSCYELYTMSLYYELHVMNFMLWTSTKRLLVFNVFLPPVPTVLEFEIFIKKPFVWMERTVRIVSRTLFECSFERCFESSCESSPQKSSSENSSESWKSSERRQRAYQIELFVVEWNLFKFEWLKSEWFKWFASVESPAEPSGDR